MSANSTTGGERHQPPSLPSIDGASVPLVPSRFNLLVPLRRGRILAHNSMSGAVAVWEREDVSEFQRAAEGLPTRNASSAAALAYGGYLVPSAVDEIGLLRSQYERHRFDPTSMVLTIAPTLACNFGCDYCFQGSDKPSEWMSIEVQDAVVEMVKRALPRITRLHVAWYGGEPLLALPVIESLSDRLIALLQASATDFDAMIVTNGYRLDATAARSLHSRRVTTAQITIDGAETDHDQRRTLLGGQPTFRRILDNIRAFLGRVPLRVTVRVNVDQRNAASLRDLIAQLANLGLGNRSDFSMYFAPVEAITEGCHSVSDLCMSKRDYGALEAELSRSAFEAGLSSLPYPRRFRGICGAVKPNGFVIAPNGDVHKCWDTVSLPGRRVGTVFNPESLGAGSAKWLDWTPFENPICVECKILPTCAGSCAHKFVNPDQTVGEAAALPCPSWRYNAHEKLLHLAEQKQAINRNDYDLLQARTDPLAICAAPVRHGEPSKGFVPLDALRVSRYEPAQ